MKKTLVFSLALCLSTFLSFLDAQETKTSLFSSDQLDNLVAPIALYPDPLLAQVLVASTYPDQIDEANRLLRARPSPIDSRSWDSSVKAVAHYPIVLQFMDDNLDWTTALGQVYVTQAVSAMKAIQRLRARARSAGTLAPGQQIDVVVSGGYVRIWPTSAQLLFVPVYDPALVMADHAASRGIALIYYGTGRKIGAWLNRDFNWQKDTVVYHGWEGNANWIVRSRPFVQVSNVYVNNGYRDSAGSRDVLNYRVNYQALNRWNDIHHNVGFGKARGKVTAGDKILTIRARETDYNKVIQSNIDVDDSRLNEFRGHTPAELNLSLLRLRAVEEGRKARPAEPLFIASHSDFDARLASQRAQNSQAEPVQMLKGYEEKLFPAPEEAMNALGEATKAKNRAALAVIFGPHNLERLLTGQSTQDDGALEQFAAKFQKSAALEETSTSTYKLVIGEDKWPFPIPIIKEGKHWRFNTALGINGILNQKLGENELSAILTCRAYVLAQWEYYSASTRAGHDGEAVYAQRFISTPGERDGLYWPTIKDEKPSPLGALVAAAGKASESPTALAFNEDAVYNTAPARISPANAIAPFHGYYFKILTRQGSHAPGGRFSYIINGADMVSGFALIAYPAQWGISGIMTFEVNQQGRVYEINLGLRTTDLASDITEYDPDPTWKLVDESFPIFR